MCAWMLLTFLFTFCRAVDSKECKQRRYSHIFSKTRLKHCTFIINRNCRWECFWRSWWRSRHFMSPPRSWRCISRLPYAICGGRIYIPPVWNRVRVHLQEVRARWRRTMRSVSRGYCELCADDRSKIFMPQSMDQTVRWIFGFEFAWIGPAAFRLCMYSQWLWISDRRCTTA